MDDLITWLKVQIDEDERVAKATTGGGLRWFANGPNDIRTMPEGHRSELGTGEPFWFQVASKAWRMEAIRGEDFEHIVRHDPARVLREVKARRRLIDLHGHESRSGWNPDEDDTPGAYGNIERACMSCGSQDLAVRWPCDTLKLVALPFSDRPGYREEWKP